jgi:tetratricopeptide (TPR) repeat protein
MIFRKLLQNVVLLLLVTLFSSPSFSYTKIKAFVLNPPEQILPGVKRIAVLDFVEESAYENTTEIESAEELGLKVLGEILFGGGDSQGSNVNHGKNFTDYLISELVLKDRGIREIKTGVFGLGKGREGKTLQQGAFTNVYEVVERTQMDQILQEQKLGLSGAVNENQVTELGKLLGVQAMITGSISTDQKDSDYKEERTEKVNNKDVTKKVDCEKREVNVKVRARIFSTETGRILASTEASESLSKSHCDDAWGSLPSAEEMIDECLVKATQKIANYFGPHYEMVEYEFEKLKVDKYKKNGDKAAKLAEDLKVDDAYVIYYQINQQESYNPEVMYNLGVLHEVVGNYDKSKSMYDACLQLDNKGRFRDAAKRIEKSVEFSHALADIGVKIQEHSFDVSPQRVTKALAKKVKTNGNRNDKINIHQQPTAKSSLVAKVPGGLTFTVVGQKGDWFLIELLGGKQGYVKNDACKLVKD